MDVLMILSLTALIFIIIEIIGFIISSYVRKNFQWLITNIDEKPNLPTEELEKFIVNGYDAELGWVRKPNTSKYEKGKTGITEWNINEKGARKNPNFEEEEIKISCYGDSFTFCRQVNDNETWEHYLSKKTNSNIQNFGVGNYGIDQALLRLKREIHNNKTNIVIMAVVPDTISRILSIWKHYYEYGNTFAFKPRYKIKNEEIVLVKNIIDQKSILYEYKKKIDKIKKDDFFYSKKFKKEKIQFPYTISILKNPKRNISIIYWVMKIKLLQKIGVNVSKIEWNPMEIIMKINLQWRIKLYKKSSVTGLLYKIIEEFVRFSKQEDVIPIFIFLPQKDDMLFIKNEYNYFENFTKSLTAIPDLNIINITKKLLEEDNLNQLYSDDNSYGGHLSKHGNEKIAEIIFEKIKKLKI
jgi:hypothetical protein